MEQKNTQSKFKAHEIGTGNVTCRFKIRLDTEREETQTICEGTFACHTVFEIVLLVDLN